VSAAVWAAVALRPTSLAMDAPQPDPQPAAAALDTRLDDALRDVEARLEDAAPAFDAEARRALAETIVQEADQARLDPLLVLAVIEVESGFQATARSDAGAIGLMQLLDSTLRSEMARQGLEGDPADPVMNVRAGVRYLRRLMNAFPHEDVALMAYYAGPVRILGYLRAGDEIPERFHVYPRRVHAVLRRMRKAPAHAPEVAAAREAAPAAPVLPGLAN
jgi:soluble lytic murein transglycosylase-like protein